MPLKPLPEYIRHEEENTLIYDVLASARDGYWPVLMVGEEAVFCECKASHFGACCRHKKVAEQAEADYQAKVQTEKRANAPLNGNKGFSFYR